MPHSNNIITAILLGVGTVGYCGIASGPTDIAKTKYRDCVHIYGETTQQSQEDREKVTASIQSIKTVAVADDSVIAEIVGKDNVIVWTDNSVEKIYEDYLKDKEYNELFRIESCQPVEAQEIEVQTEAPTNLARLDQPEGDFTDTEYRYQTSGKGVNVYVIDKPVNVDHEDFFFKDGTPGTRAQRGILTFPGSVDCSAHGTHVAGVVGGLKYGVAKDATIYEVAVQPCSVAGNTGYVLSGMQWILDNVKYPAVAQMSLVAMGTSSALDEKVKQLVRANIPAVVSAGNYAADACFFSPCGIQETIAVGNVDFFDTRNRMSNYGNCVFMFAPGTYIQSASATDNTGVTLMTGTSQAAPHVSGVIAQYFERNPTASIEQVKTMLIDTAAVGKVKDEKGAPNRLLQVNLAEVTDTGAQEKFSNTPGFAIRPEVIAPVALYQNARTQNEAKLFIQNYKGGTLEWKGEVTPLTDSDVDWIVMDPITGNIESTEEIKEQQQVTIRFDSTKLDGQADGNPKQGIYAANVKFTSNDPNKTEHMMQVQMLLFCERLAKPTAIHQIIFKDGSISGNRPKSWDTQAGEEQSTVPLIYMQVDVEFSHPMLDVEAFLQGPQLTDGFSVPDGTVEQIIPNKDNPQCGQFTLRITKNRGDPWQGGNKVCVKVPQDKIRDIHGDGFPAAEHCMALEERPSAMLYGVYLTYSAAYGAVTEDSEVLLLAGFTQPITKLDESMIEIRLQGSNQKAEVASIEPVPDKGLHHHITVKLPEDYYGDVTVSLITQKIEDATGRKVKPTDSLVFKRVQTAIVKPSAYEVKQEL